MLKTTDSTTVLQDPSVASAPVEQRIAFLRSKNLTQEEIDASLARVGQAAPQSQDTPPVQYRQSPSQQYGNNGGYYGQGYPPQWQQPPEAPQRDWRDYFIAATVMSGVGYGIYWTAKRYIYPLVAPPTPPQLEQDKKSVDDSFEKAFALLDQLATDTQELKDAEAARKQRLDAALGEVESVISRMKQANDERELESKRIAREISEIRDQIPKAIEREKEQTENRLKDLATEMKSLKTLVGNRMQGGGVAPTRTTPSYSNQSQSHDRPSSGHVLGGAGGVSTNGISGASALAQEPAAETNGINGTSSNSATEHKSSNPYTAAAPTSRDGSNTPYSRLLGGGNKAAIPSWQLAAKKKSDEAKADAASSGSATPVQNVNESGTASEVADGQA